MDVKKSGVFLVVIFLLSVVAEFDQRKDSLITFVTATPQADVKQVDGLLAQPPVDDLESFQAALIDAVTQQNYEELQTMMSNPFHVSGWRAESSEWIPEIATNQLRTRYLSPDAVVMVDSSTRAEGMLAGTDLAFTGGSDVDVASVIHSQGWGEDGRGEVLLVISHVGGIFAWYAMLYAPLGF